MPERAGDATSLELAAVLNNFGVACKYTGRFDDAEVAYRRALAIFERTFDPGHPHRVTCARNLAGVGVRAPPEHGACLN